MTSEDLKQIIPFKITKIKYIYVKIPKNNEQPIFPLEELNKQIIRWDTFL
jgi:hypothetical protein